VDSFSLSGRTFYNSLFPKDAINGLKSYDQFLFEREETHGSMFLSLLNDLEQQLSSRAAADKMAERYPEGLPRVANTDVYFSLEQVIQGAGDLLRTAPPPFFAYLHFISPHAPYLPSRDFLGVFNDGWSPPAKKKHRLSAGATQKRLVELRQTYDEYVANLDAELGKMLDSLESSGLLENSYLIFTSDHGELFERGEHGHTTALMFEPILRIPLLISTPGQRGRQDISALTTNVDLLPTLSKIAGLDVPVWCEGQVLPGMGGSEPAERSIFAVEAKKNPAHNPLEKASLALIRGKYKLVRYLGYRNVEGYEFYDLENDPEELDNGYDSHPAAKELQVELDAKLQQVNQPYLGKG
jgi:arylsulfatase A-like enzyme